jgi:maltose 6'-phosphate phosphatase
MIKIRLVSAGNVIDRDSGRPVQHLSFLVRLANVAFEKQVDVLWAGEDHVWRTLPARYLREAPEGDEYWVASTELAQDAEHSLAGNVELCLRYRVQGQQYWDNNEGRNHAIEADAGIRLPPGLAMLDLSSQRPPRADARLLPVAVAVDARLEAERVTIHWTTDDWQTTRYSSCRRRCDYWDAACSSNARNPNQYGVEVWDAQLNLERAPSALYRIVCESPRGRLWDDDAGRSYRLAPPRLKVMVLNLHCYQEADQQRKFRQIAAAIDELEVDVVCFQEVAENWNEGRGDWGSNSARIINEQLRRPYHLASDWSHLGFDRYREGVAVLSRHPIVRQESRYVSRSQDPYSIHARKVVLAQIDVPAIGIVNVFSTHLSWWNDGFAEQFGSLRQWAREAHGTRVAGTLLCGDFNIEAGSRGYELVLESGEYEDGFLAATRPDAFSAVFGNRTSGWREQLRGDGRIDYVFVRKGSGLRVIGGHELFTEHAYGRVSDHTGYLLTFTSH